MEWQLQKAVRTQFVQSNSWIICAQMKDRFYIIGELKEKIISWTKMESRIVPMKKLPKHSQIQTIIRTQVLITILDFQSMEQVLILRMDSRILQRRKNLWLQIITKRKKPDARQWESKCWQICFRSQKNLSFFHILHSGHISSHRNWPSSRIQFRILVGQGW